MPVAAEIRALHVLQAHAGGARHIVVERGRGGPSLLAIGARLLGGSRDPAVAIARSVLARFTSGYSSV